MRYTIRFKSKAFSEMVRVGRKRTREMVNKTK